MIEDGAFMRIINNPLAQFGPDHRKYLGATLLPELNVPENAYVEEGIKYRTQIANAGTRYSPVQLKQGILQGSMTVVLGESDIGSQFTGSDYDALIRILEKAQVGTGGGLAGTADRPTMTAATSLLNWVDATVNLPLIEMNEVQRWQAIINAQVIRTGDGGYTETVNYPNPTGHRVTAGGTWSNNSYDPYLDFMAAQAFLAALGYTINRIITSTPVMLIMAGNTNMRERLGIASVAAGLIVGLRGHASKAAINQFIAQDDLPPIETYDLQYRTQTGSGYFFPRGTMVFACTTQRDMAIDLGDLQPFFSDGMQQQWADGVNIPNTLGYVGVGRAAGQSQSGRVVVTNAYENKPPRVEAEGWQTSLPVITEPEALYVITGID